MEGRQKRCASCGSRHIFRDHCGRHRIRWLTRHLGAPNVAKYPSQQILVVSYERYVYLVPYVEEDAYLFLKTIIPSRKATRDYLNRGASDAED